MAGRPYDMTSTTESTAGSVTSGLRRFEMSELRRHCDELPRFGACEDAEDLDSGPSAEPGSVEAIIKEFTRSMKKVNTETSRHLRSLSPEQSTGLIRDAWAYDVSGAPTPAEGSVCGRSSPCIRSPRQSARNPAHATSMPSLKAAAMAVVGHGRSGLRSGLLSGKETPQSSNRSPRASPRQLSRDSSRSAMLTAPWQQYKDVAKRMQSREAGDSNCSTPRSSTTDLRAMGSKSKRDSGYAQQGGPPPRTSQLFNSPAMALIPKEPHEHPRTFSSSNVSEEGSLNGTNTPRNVVRKQMQPPEVAPEETPKPLGTATYPEETLTDGSCA